jgi:hypothetical protein
MAPIVYTAEGERITKLLWDETITELSFAHVGDVIQEVGQLS